MDPDTRLITQVTQAKWQPSSSTTQSSDDDAGSTIVMTLVERSALGAECKLIRVETLKAQIEADKRSIQQPQTN